MEHLSAEDYGTNNFPIPDIPLDYDYNSSSIEAGAKVVGGNPAFPGQFPYLISLQMADGAGKYGQWCGATVIHPLILLTAAHCLFNYKASSFRAVSGEQNLNVVTKTEQIRSINRLVVHPNYDNVTQVNDIGLLLLDRPLIYDKFTKPIRMADGKPTVLSKATIAGWGKTGKRSVAPSPILQFATIKMELTLDECRQKWPQRTVTEKQLCAGGVKDTCQGDSGGPLTGYSPAGERYVCGIVSWGRKECKSAAVPGVYTDVSAYREWIMENVQEMQQMSQAARNGPLIRKCGPSTSSTSVMFCATCGSSKKEAEAPFIATYNVHMDIKNRYSSTRVLSTMFNPHKKNGQEVTFSVLVPESALISGFLMAIDGTETHACAQKVQSLGGNAIVQTQGQQNDLAGGIMESSIPNFNRFNFTTKIAPLTVVNFALTYEEPLLCRRNVYRQTIHVDPEMVFEAHDCNVKVTISDSGAIQWLRTFGNDSTNEVTDNVQKQWDERGGSINWRPTPSLTTSGDPRTSHSLDLQFGIGENESDKAGRILIHGDHFVHFLPSRHLETFEMPPKHFIFILDTSSSMSGKKWTTVLTGMNTILGGLYRNHRRDYFNIIAFDQKVTVWNGRPVVASSSGQMTSIAPPIRVTDKLIKQAQNFLRTLKVKDDGEDDDGWDLYAALQTALKISGFSNKGAAGRTTVKSPVIILFSSSNSSTSNSNGSSGVTDEEEIQREILALNEDQQVPIYSIAFVDSQHDDGFSKPSAFPFLRQLSTLNNGLAVKIPLRSDPTATQLKLKDTFVEIASLFPLPQLSFTYSIPSTLNLTVVPAVMNKFSSYIYRGSNVVVAGEIISPAGSIPGNLTTSVGTICNNSSPLSNDSMRVVVTANPMWTQGSRVFSAEQLIPTHSSSNNNTVMSTIAPSPALSVSSTASFVPRIWAYLKMKELLEELEKLMVLNDGDNADVEEITAQAQELAVEHGFLTPLTTYEVTKPGGKTATLKDQVNGDGFLQAGTNGTGLATVDVASLINISTSQYCSE